MKWQSNCLLGLYSSEGLTGLEDSLLSLLTWLLAGGLSSLPHGPLHTAVHDMASGFPQSKWSEKEVPGWKAYCLIT